MAEQGEVVDGAAGRQSGKGFVYILEIVEDGNHRIEIGCSEVPKRRQTEIQRDDLTATLLVKIKATEMNGAKTAAQNKAEELGLQKVEKATDGFHKPENIANEKIISAVRNAVYQHNSIEKIKSKIAAALPKTAERTKYADWTKEVMVSIHPSLWIKFRKECTKMLDTYQEISDELYDNVNQQSIERAFAALDIKDEE